MGRRSPENSTPKKTNNSIKELVGNDENRYLAPDPNKTMVNITNETSDAHKNSLKEEVMEEITEKHMEKLLDIKQLNGLRQDFNKLQSKTKETTNER
jgi:hypothetical protein